MASLDSKKMKYCPLLLSFGPYAHSDEIVRGRKYLQGLKGRVSSRKKENFFLRAKILFNIAKKSEPKSSSSANDVSASTSAFFSR